MSEQTEATTKTATKKKAAKKAAKKAKATAKRIRPAKEDGLVVFAHRMSLEEREAFHTAAGPAKASKVARALAVAFTNGDEAAFRALVKEAREARS